MIYFHGICNDYFLNIRRRPISSQTQDYKVENFVTELEPGTKALNIGYCGTLKEYQGVDDLLKAMQLIDQQGYLFNLYIIGGLGLGVPYFQSIARDLNIHKSTIFTGMLDHPNALEYMSKMDLLISPRKNTEVTKGGFVSQLPEYMATGKAVIATDVSDCRTMLGEDYFGLVMADSPVELARKIQEVIASPKLLLEMGETCYEKSKDWSWSTNAVRLIELYQAAIL